MTRQIKSRAWDRRGVMHYNLPLVYSLEDKGYVVMGSNKSIFGKVEIMFSVGLKDIKGKDIYEGDIIKIDAGTNQETLCEVFYLDGGFVLIGDGYDGEAIGAQIISYGETNGIFGEVIGNIYENTELLTQ